MLRPDFRQIRHSTELYHYGMPRRSGRYPWGSGDRPYQSVKNALKGKERSEYFTSERVIPKGTKMFRTVSNDSSSFRKNEPTYVTYLDPDRDLYKSGYIRNRDRSQKVYEYEMTLSEDLKIPSRETFKQTIHEVIKQNPKLLKESVESYLELTIPENSLSRYQIEVNPNTGEYDKSRWNKFVNQSYFLRKSMPIEEQWGSISVSLGKADKLKGAIIDDLKKQGYNAIVDEAGVGGSERIVEGIDPLIIFDSSILSINKTKEINKREEEQSRKDYNKWARKSIASGNKNAW